VFDLSGFCTVLLISLLFLPFLFLLIAGFWWSNFYWNQMKIDCLILLCSVDILISTYLSV
jgi:hypothetical protein